MVRHRQWRFLERERVDIPSDPARCIYGNVSSASQPYYSDLLQRSSKRASRTELPGNPHGDLASPVPAVPRKLSISSAGLPCCGGRLSLSKACFAPSGQGVPQWNPTPEPVTVIVGHPVGSTSRRMNLVLSHGNVSLEGSSAISRPYAKKRRRGRPMSTRNKKECNGTCR